MKQTVSIHTFRQTFNDFGRNDQFSYEGLEALFDYLEECEDSTGTEMELDVIALCCEYTEFENIKEFQDNYGEGYESMNDIEGVTTVIHIDGSDSFIIQDF